MRIWRRFIRQVYAVVAATPADRERWVDFLRVFAIAVVVLWHWSLSVIHWSGDRFVMPNPIDHVPGGWLFTWLLQIVPVFFIVGGYANNASWRSSQRRGEGWRRYLGRRLRRLLVPVGVFVALWLAFEVVMHMVVPDYTGVLTYAWIVFTPLWFIGAYTGVVLLVPVTARLHARAPGYTLATLAAAVVAADVGRFAFDVPVLGWVNTALVWVLIHQFGYFYEDGTLPRLGRPAGAALSVTGLALLAGMTTFGPYPGSMVATPVQDFSNILPTTAAIPATALFQFGLILLLRDRMNRWLRQPVAWRPVVAANSVILTIFVWHMTAALIALALYRAIGGELLAEPTALWWAQRWVWIVLPALFLVPFVAAFGRLEVGGLLRSRGHAAGQPARHPQTG